jgi:hypothetical protein
MGRSTSTEKLVCVVVAVLAVLSPLYIDRRPEAERDEDDGAVAARPAGRADPGHQRDVLREPARGAVRPVLDPPRVGLLRRAHAHAAAARLRAQV